MDYKIVDNFMYYVFNKWCMEEAVRNYGENLGMHIFKKWEVCRIDGGDQLEWYANLDSECRRKLVERANGVYNK